MTQSSCQQLSLGDALEAYLQTLSELSPRSTKKIKEHLSQDAQFKDPFFDVRSPEQIEKAFNRMFDLLDRPQYVFHEKLWSQDGKTAYLRWSFLFYDKGRRQEVPGMGEVRFSEKGLVESHTDYWDASEHVFEKIPVLGSLLRMVKKKVTG